MNFASLFSGCGGFDLGFLANGFEPKGAFDIEKSAVENFRNNVHQNIECVDLTGELSNLNHLKNIDVLVAGPPCQGFSTAGKRLVDDTRNHLIPLTGEYAKFLKPKILIVENVVGALSGEHSKYFNQLEEMMRGVGYQTNTIKFQTTDLGMAQQRKRVLFFAWLTGKDFDFSYEKQSPKTLKSALHSIDNTPNHEPVELIPQTKDWLIANKIKQGQKLSNVRGGNNSIPTWNIPEVFGHVSDDEKTILELLRRLRRQERTRSFGDADPVSLKRLESALGKEFVHHVESLINKGYLKRIDDHVDLIGTFNGKYRRLDWSKPSYTVDTRFGAARYFLHPSQNRGFTVREAARIQGFDDKYIFSGTMVEQFKMIGNAVPPPLAGLAASFTRNLLGAL